MTNPFAQNPMLLASAVAQGQQMGMQRQQFMQEAQDRARRARQEEYQLGALMRQEMVRNAAMEREQSRQIVLDRLAEEHRAHARDMAERKFAADQGYRQAGLGLRMMEARDRMSDRAARRDLSERAFNERNLQLPQVDGGPPLESPRSINRMRVRPTGMQIYDQGSWLDGNIMLNIAEDRRAAPEGMLPMSPLGPTESIEARGDWMMEQALRPRPQAAEEAPAAPTQPRDTDIRSYLNTIQRLEDARAAIDVGGPSADDDRRAVRVVQDMLSVPGTRTAIAANPARAIEFLQAIGTPEAERVATEIRNLGAEANPHSTTDSYFDTGERADFDFSAPILDF